MYVTNLSNVLFFSEKNKVFKKKNRTFSLKEQELFKIWPVVFFHNGIYMPKRLIFPSDLSAPPQTPCPSAFRLKDMHCEMFQPENILQKNQFPKNWKDTGLAEGFQSRLKDSRAQFFSRKADGQGICEHAERFEGFFKVLYIEYYERPYLTEKSKISSWNMYVVLLCSETYLTLSTKISHFSLQQYRPHCPKLKQ